MLYSPSLEKVKEIASCGKYNILPVSCEILSDICTPIEALRILKNVSRHCYILESVVDNEKWGRYTFLGFDPKLEISCSNGEMKVGDVSFTTNNPSDKIREILSQYKSPKFDYLPSFTGGLVGYFSYDYLGYSEPAVRTDVEDTENFKDVDLMLFDKVIAFDNLRKKIILIVNMSLEEPESGYNKAIFELNKLKELLVCGEKKKETNGRLTGEVTALFSKEQFCDMVEKAKYYIKEGDIFQIVLSNRLSAPFEGSLLMKDFTVDTENSKRMRKLVGENIIFVSESGIKTAADITLLREIGADAVLIGETLMRAENKKEKLAELRGTI